MFLITDNCPRSICHHASGLLGLEHDPAVLSLSIAKSGLPCVGCCVAIPNDARLSVNDKSHYSRYTMYLESNLDRVRSIRWSREVLLPIL